MFSIRTTVVGALALVGSACLALAADLPNYQPPPSDQVYNPTPAFDWTGPYVGLTGGYVPAYNNLGTNNGQTRADPSRWNARRDSAVRGRY